MEGEEAVDGLLPGFQIRLQGGPHVPSPPERETEGAEVRGQRRVSRDWLLSEYLDLSHVFALPHPFSARRNPKAVTSKNPSGAFFMKAAVVPSVNGKWEVKERQTPKAGPNQD